MTQVIDYRGEEEFEDICRAFNQMQAHILAEREKNQTYEKARTEMVAGISHDLRTPLTAIRGSIKGIAVGVLCGYIGARCVQYFSMKTKTKTART